MNFSLYEMESGRIVSVGSATSEELALAQAGDGQGILLGDGLSLSGYVVSGQFVPRPEFPVSQFDNTLHVPPGTEFSVRGPASMAGVAADGLLEFEFAEPGTYTVTLRKFPYLDREVTLEG
jgi:hypothetical protein